MQLPETRTMIHEVRETRISKEDDDNNDAKGRKEEDNEDKGAVDGTTDGDLVWEHF